ncbi:MAG: penicillin-binding protein 2 [Lachnospiraceae bacterium]|nr:penicillin-binding protein 2 [Lachnospiraceae bacterium]
MRGKLAFTFLVIVLALFALGIAVAAIGYDDNEEYAKIVLSQQDYDSRVVTARRGNIIDRNGNVLATNETLYNLILDPAVILADENYTETTLNALAECYGYSKEELTTLIHERSKSHYVRYTRQMPEEEMTRFLELQKQINEDAYKSDKPFRVKGVWFETEYKRIYPYGDLACRVIGFSSADGTSGSYGIEQYYNENLAGINGREYGYLSEEANLERVTKDAVNGDTLVSTLDANIQRIVERRIEEFMSTVGAKTTAVIVMDPDNAEVLAMATSNSFDLNAPRDVLSRFTDEQIRQYGLEEGMAAYNREHPEAPIAQEQVPEVYTEEEIRSFGQQVACALVWKNYCISETIEPGSTAKVFTVAAGLEEGILHTTDTFYCDGGEDFPGTRVTCHLKSGHGTLDVTGALAESCNDALMQIGFRIGADVFSKYLELFNFGMKTGVDLPGEERGILYEPENITNLTLATEAFGQNYNVTMIQMAAAYCSLINGGYYYEPHVVRQILDENGDVKQTITKTLVRETVSRSTSEFIRQALLQTVDEGSGTAAAIAGYTVAGKTGTAQKYPREAEHYLISFTGFVPYDDPQVFIYVVIDEPNVEDQSRGGYGTALTKTILQDLLAYMNIYPTREVPESSPEEGGGETAPEGGEASSAPEEGEGNQPVQGGEEEPTSEEGGIYSGNGDNSVYEGLQQQPQRERPDD